MADFRPYAPYGSGMAEETEVRRRALGDVRGHEVELEQCAVRSVSGEEVEVEQSAVVFARAGRMKMEGSASVVVAARTVEAEDLRALFVLAPSVRGNVRTLFDLRTALAAGAGFFLARRGLRLANDMLRFALGRRKG